MKNLSRDITLRWLLFGAYVVLTIWLTANHELWRDEADSWLLARDGSLLDIFKIMPDAGHPPLWYLLLKPLASAGLSWRWMQGINLLAMCLATGLLIFKSGFDLIFIAPVVLSFVFSYEFPVIARNYSLGILGLFLYSANHQSRQRHNSFRLLLAHTLMCFSTVHFLGLAAVLFFDRGVTDFSKNKRWVNFFREWLKSERIFLLLFVLSVAILWPSGKGQFSADFFEHFIPMNFRDSIAQSILPFEPATSLTFVLAVSVYALILASIREFDRTAGLFLAGAGIIGAIFVFKYYSGSPRHSGLFLVWLCACLWMTTPTRASAGLPLFHRRRLAPIAMWIVCAWNLPVVASVWELEVTGNFSDAHEAAVVLNSAPASGRQVVCWIPRNCIAILPYLSADRKFWYPVVNREGTFDFWDKKSNSITDQAFKRSINIDQILTSTITKFPNWGKKYGPLFVSNWPVSEPEKFGLKLLSPAKKSAWRILDESFWIYGPQEMETR